MMNDCPTCGALLASDGRTFFGFQHVCPPLWTVWCPEQGDDTKEDGRDFRSADAEGAARAWAARQDEGEVWIADGCSPTVHVCPKDAEEPIDILEVSGQAITDFHYTARSIG